MKKMLKTTLVALCVASLAGGAHAQERRGFFSQLGVDTESYMPFSGKTRDRFGSRFTGVGLGFGSITPDVKRAISPDVTILNQSQSGDRALLVLGGLQYRKPFSSDTKGLRFVPYYGVGANLIYGRLRVDGERDSNFGAGASLFVGTTFTRHAFVEARVRALSKVASYDFSGLSLSAGVRF